MNRTWGLGAPEKLGALDASRLDGTRSKDTRCTGRSVFPAQSESPAGTWSLEPRLANELEPPCIVESEIKTASVDPDPAELLVVDQVPPTEHVIGSV